MEVSNQTGEALAESLTIRKAVRCTPWVAAVAVCLVSLAIIYSRAFAYWWRTWWMEGSYYSHGILIPFMSAFVIYINRQSIAKVKLNPSLWGIILIVPFALIQLLARSGNTMSTEGLTFPFVLLGVSLLLFGIEMTRYLLFPIAFTSFMCVLPGFLLTKMSFKIQILSTTLATHLLNLMQFNARQDGTQISLPNIDVTVAEPCSGFKMLISLLAFSVFFAYLKEGPRWGRLSLVILTVPLSLLANSVRVALIALWGEFFGNEAMLKFHDYSGFIVLLIAFVVLWWLAKVVKCEKFKPML